jgi:hypothetical protein
MGGDIGGDGMDNDGFADENRVKRPPSAQTGGTAVISTGGTGYGFGTTAPSRTAPSTGGVLPPTGAGSWGFGTTAVGARPGTSDAYGGSGGVDALFEHSNKGQLQRQPPQQLNQQPQRPHTAHGAGRVIGSNGLPSATGHVEDDGMEVGFLLMCSTQY